MARRCLGGGGAGCGAWRSVWRPWIGIGTEGLGVEQHVQDSAIASNGRLLRGWIDIFSSSYSLLVLTGTPPIIPLWGMWGRWLNPAHPSIGPWVSHAWGAVPVRATMRQSTLAQNTPRPMATTVTLAHSIPRPCLPVEFHIGRYARVFVWRSGGGLIKNFRWRADTQDRLERSRPWWRTLVPSKMGEIWGRVSSQKLQLGIV